MTSATQVQGDIRTFNSRISVKQAFMNRLRQRIGSWLLKDSLPIFLRGGDSITLDPLVNGYWEQVLTAFIKTAAGRGYDGFLLDIGANVGLTSCQCGDSFREVCMFEPNPELFPILELNTRLMLRLCTTRAFNVGLGPVATEATLNVPTNNWGGAFVRDSHNAYSDSLFATRHLVEQLDLTAYRQIAIRIEAAANVCPEMFGRLSRSGLNTGVIKLDTEGYEKAILESLAPHIPPHFRVVVVFENWDPDLDTEALAARFERPVATFRLVRRPRQRGALWRDLPFMVPLGGMQFSLESVAKGECDGDIVFVVDPKPASDSTVGESMRHGQSPAGDRVSA